VQHDRRDRIGSRPHIYVAPTQQNHIGLFARSKRAEPAVKPEALSRLDGNEFESLPYRNCQLVRHGLPLMEGIVRKRPLCLDEKAHLGKHVGAHACYDIGPDIEFGAGGEHCAGGREAQPHLHFNFWSDGDTCTIVGDDPELISGQKISVDQVNVLAEQALLRQTVHRLRPWSMLGTGDVERGQKAEFASEPDIRFRRARREVSTANGERHRHQCVAGS